MKKLLLPLLAVLLFSTCQKPITTEKLSEEKGSVAAAKNPADKMDVCHYDAVTNSWHTINISLNAWPGHQSHGDVRLDDQDGDGYVLNNECSVGPMGDCDDNNAVVNPGVSEICGNGIDDNCDGVVDEGGCKEVITICNQTWMLKNLDVSKYRNGEDIPQVTDPAEWAALTTGAWCYYNNDPANNAVYGKLYNWYAVNDPRGLAPFGWHVPSDAEWTTLKICVDAILPTGNPGGKMKTTGTIEESTGLWHAPNLGATNESGFAGLPGGTRSLNGWPFYALGYFGGWWSSTEHFSSITAWDRGLISSGGSILRNYADNQFGFSVRCLGD